MPKVKTIGNAQLSVQYMPGHSLTRKGRKTKLLEIGSEPVSVYADERDFLLGMYQDQIVEVKD